MCGIIGLTRISCKDVRQKEKKIRLSNDEYTRYLEYYKLKDSEHNYKCFVIWKGFGMSL